MLSVASSVASPVASLEVLRAPAVPLMPPPPGRLVAQVVFWRPW